MKGFLWLSFRAVMGYKDIIDNDYMFDVHITKKHGYL